jgi:hypothetical protein
MAVPYGRGGPVPLAALLGVFRHRQLATLGFRIGEKVTGRGGDGTSLFRSLIHDASLCSLIARTVCVFAQISAICVAW